MSSRLGSLFGMNSSSDMDSSDSLKYSAPKEPRKGSAKQAAGGTSPASSGGEKAAASAGGM